MRAKLSALMVLKALIVLACPVSVAAQDAPLPAPLPAIVTEAPVVDTPPIDETPIIIDADFDAALPSLDEAPVAESETPDPDVAPIIAEDGESLDLPEPAPLDDPAMQTALEPIESFDPNAAPVIEVVESGDAPPVLRYHLSVNGLAQFDLEKRFKDLSALAEGDGKADNAAMLRARLTEDEQTAIKLLWSEGYYDAVVVARAEQATTPEGRTQITVSASPGEPYRLKSITVIADPTEPPTLIRDALTLKVGDLVASNLIKGAEANVRLTLPQNGYPFAEVGLRDIVLDPHTREGDYTLPVTTGPRARFGGFVAPDDDAKAFGLDHVEVLSRFKRDDLYDSRQVDDLRQALTATGLFASVGVEPVLSEAKAADGTAIVDMKITQNAGKARTLSGDIGFSTGQGLRTELNWTHRNFRPPEGALIASIVVGTQEQGVAASFRRSNAKRRDRTFQIGAGFDNQSYDSYEAQTIALAASVSRVSTPLWQKTWTWSYGAEILATREEAFSLTKLAPERIDYFYASTPIKIGYDRTDNLLNPSTGWRAGVQSTPSVSLNGTGGNFIVNVAEASYYRPLSPKLVMAMRARVGSIAGSDLSGIAPSRRLYAGGGGSVRGFGYQELGPRGPSNDPTGGRSVVELAFEVRYRFGNFGIVPFIDAGQVYDAQFPEFSDIRFGIGIGARYYTNFGPVRFDIATPIGREDGESPVSIYVGIGQAF